MHTGYNRKDRREIKINKYPFNSITKKKPMFTVYGVDSLPQQIHTHFPFSMSELIKEEATIERASKITKPYPKTHPPTSHLLLKNINYHFHLSWIAWWTKIKEKEKRKTTPKKHSEKLLKSWGLFDWILYFIFYDNRNELED